MSERSKAKINIPLPPKGIEEINGRLKIICGNCNFKFEKASRCSACGQLQKYNDAVNDEAHMEWIIPANPMIYNVDASLRDLGRIDWFQSKPMNNFNVGDTVYIYVGKPFGAIKWKCRVNKVNIETLEIDDDDYCIQGASGFYGPYIEIETIHYFEAYDLLSLDKLHDAGVNGHIQGPRKVGKELSAYIDSVEKVIPSDEELEKIQIIEDKYLKSIKKEEKSNNKPLKKIITPENATESQWYEIHTAMEVYNVSEEEAFEAYNESLTIPFDQSLFDELD